jgi:hypothetical protein
MEAVGKARPRVRSANASISREPGSDYRRAIVQHQHLRFTPEHAAVDDVGDLVVGELRRGSAGIERGTGLEGDDAESFLDETRRDRSSCCTEPDDANIDGIVDDHRS